MLKFGKVTTETKICEVGSLADVTQAKFKQFEKAGQQNRKLPAPGYSEVSQTTHCVTNPI